MLARKLIFQTSKIRASTLGLATIFSNNRYTSTLTKLETASSEKPVLDPYLKVPKVYRRTFARSHDISTLDPARLVPSDFIDFKQQLHFAVRYCNMSVMYATYKRIVIKAKKNVYPLTFPAGSHGYMYLHRPPADVHPCAATLRFRICDKLLPPQKGFSSGKDLLLPKGAPWEMDLLHLLTSTFVTNFREALLLDNLVSEEVLSQLDLVAARQRGSRVLYHLLFSFQQPFSVSMAQRSTTLSVVDLETSTISQAQVVTTIAKRKDKTLSCTMCLEYNPSARRRMVIRVLQIPKEFRGETFVNEGDILPLTIAGKTGSSSMADILLRQSPSVPSHADQSLRSLD
ncbi:hypothetical protein BDP27DRAFT_1451035 [Rhodocollybia butyracea]|uniref:Uncharacterized protein n=1 Tax=Rhodocollybia butyracea TaxID=206335 RepID=A0A9P5PI86_9AGAR|nr:hypothetical protein BDP27DRAFT_1451035 [Rhodocollybia butyracea]